jgi:hypothetical protein
MFKRFNVGILKGINFLLLNTKIVILWYIFTQRIILLIWKANPPGIGASIEQNMG